ncbi:MAG: hypothetical protein HC880_06665, partial [Bacteroidia bacterium]|nr:hypothetical protein [Bacteroidia bacterium]
TDTLEAEIEPFVETLRISGLHRTRSEILGKGSFMEQTAGGNILYTNRDRTLQIGATFVHTHYDLPLMRNNRSRKDSIRNQFEFRGQDNYNIGVDFSYNWRNFSFLVKQPNPRVGAEEGWVVLYPASHPM